MDNQENTYKKYILTKIQICNCINILHISDKLLILIIFKVISQYLNLIL